MGWLPYFTNLEGVLQTRGIIKGLDKDSPQSPVKVFYSLIKLRDNIFKFLKRHHIDVRKHDILKAHPAVLFTMNMCTQIGYATDLF